MKIVVASYTNSPEFDQPGKWLQRIGGYVGVLVCLSKYYTVNSIEQINYTGEYVQNGVHHYFLNYGKRRSFVPWRLNRFIKKLKPDIVLIHGMDVPLQTLQLKIQLGKKVKIIVQHHAEMPFTGYKKLIQRWADNCISAYMFTSVEMGEVWIRKGIIASLKKIWGIMEASSFFTPMDTNMARTKTGTKGNDVYLFVGRLDENKDPLTVVKAFLQFKKINHHVHLYMIYATTELLPELRKLLANDINENAVTLVGHVPHDEMLYWYNSSNFIISGSHYEGSGVAVCEGMSCGCIPILTDIPSFRKMTGNGCCGVLFEKGNPASLLNALTKTIDMTFEEERKKVLQQFTDDLSFEAIARQIHEKISGLYNYSG